MGDKYILRRLSPAVTVGGGEILGICEGAKEDKSGWSAFLRHLVERGLKGVRLIISDACRGLVERVAEHLFDAQWQPCMVHFCGSEGNDEMRCMAASPVFKGESFLLRMDRGDSIDCEAKAMARGNAL